MLHVSARVYISLKKEKNRKEILYILLLYYLLNLLILFFINYYLLYLAANFVNNMIEMSKHLMWGMRQNL